MKTMMISDFLALGTSLGKNAALWALLSVGTLMVAGASPLIVLLVGLPMAQMVLMPMLLRDQRRDWIAFRQSLPLSRADVVAGRYASVGVIVAGCVALGAVAYVVSCAIIATVPGLPLIAHFTVGFDAPQLVTATAGSFALTLTTFSATLPFIFAGTNRNAVTYVPAAFMLAILVWLYQLRSIDFDAFFPFVGMMVAAAQTLGGSLLIAACVLAAACTLYIVSERAAVRAYGSRDL